MFFAALSLMAAPLVEAPRPINNIHKIYCTTANGDLWQGTGFFIKPGIMVTAHHVISGKATCKDSWTGLPLTPYKEDRLHDFALLSGSFSSSYVRYSCSRPGEDVTYTSYGYSSDYPGGDFFAPKFWEKKIVATKNKYVGIPGLYNLYPMRSYENPIMAGMSGGPVANRFGVVVSINNAGNDETTYLFDLADTGLCTNKWD